MFGILINVSLNVRNYTLIILIVALDALTFTHQRICAINVLDESLLNSIGNLEDPLFNLCVTESAC